MAAASGVEAVQNWIKSQHMQDVFKRVNAMSTAPLEFIWLICVGLLFPATVTLLNFESNRLMGPNIAGAISGLAPVFAVLLALALLGESIHVLQFLGITAIVAGVMFMYR
jgi:drug/metabolite transporter (DMT)-like permease